MNSTGEQRNLLSTSGRVAAVLLLVAGLIYVAGGPLKTARPISKEEILTPALSDEWVRARLWQDPFLAVQQTVDEYEPKGIDEKLAAFAQLPLPTQETQASQKSAQPEFTNSLQRRCAKPPIKVLGVMVFGGAYHEQIEGRIRTRYATLSALGQLGYTPVDPEHIGAFVVAREGTRRDQLPPIIPYEWFQGGDGDGPTTLLVLWLLDEPFGHDDTPDEFKPFSKLANLLGMLAKAAGDDDNSCIQNKHVFITGPAGSGTLRAMVKEAAQEEVVEGECPEDSELLPCRLEELTMVSPSATAAGEDWLSLEREPAKGLKCEDIADRELLRTLCIEGKPLGPKHTHENISDLLSERLKVTFTSTIGTDPVLMKSLEAELGRRGVDLGKDHIAVVSEWDTHYGRALPTGLKAIVEDQEKHFQTEDTFHQFSYMRGIDGRITGSENGNGGNGNGSGTTADAPPGVPEAETGLQRASGRTQIDYLERLASKLQRLDQQIKVDPASDLPSPFSTRGLKAIGVLGSDVYDKLLVVQALRPRFRDAVFFTTDLDSGLWHPDEFKFTRNMIVSSNYGLELADKYYPTTNLPPFRDNYQTARYLATLVALDEAQASDWKENRASIEPRIFEIGRRGPVDLSSDRATMKSCPPESSEDQLYPCPPVHQQSWGTLETIYLVAAFVFGAGFLWFYKEHYRRFPVRRETPPVLAIAALPIALFALVASLQGAEGEPLTLLDGVSIWPAEAIRLMAGALAVYLLVSACGQIRRSDDDLRTRYKGKGSTAEQLRTYETASEPRKRLRRAAWLSVLYLLFAIAILHVFGFPNVPYRGRFSLAVHVLVTLGFSVIPLLLLLFFVLDATKLSSWLTRALSAKKATWDEDSSARSTKRRTESGKIVEMPADWTTIRFIADQTETVGRQVYYPTIVMLLMFVSRASFFDNWALSIGLLIVGLIALAYVIFCALCLRRAAEDARANALQRLEDRILDDKRTGEKQDADVLHFVQTDIQKMAKGAFVPIPEQPWLRTLLLLFGGGGSFLVFEYMVWLK